MSAMEASRSVLCRYAARADEDGSVGALPPPHTNGTCFPLAWAPGELPSGPTSPWHMLCPRHRSHIGSHVTSHSGRMRWVGMGPRAALGAQHLQRGPPAEPWESPVTDRARNTCYWSIKQVASTSIFTSSPVPHHPCRKGLQAVRFLSTKRVFSVLRMKRICLGNTPQKGETCA